MTRRYGRPDADKRIDVAAWHQVRDQQNGDVLPIATNPLTIAVVESHYRKSRRRTADIPIKCGDHSTGYAVALAVRDDRVELRYTKPPGTDDPVGHALPGTLARPLRLTCPVCGRRSPDRNGVWVLKAAIAALAKPRPAVQIRTT